MHYHTVPQCVSLFLFIGNGAILSTYDGDAVHVVRHLLLGSHSRCAAYFVLAHLNQLEGA